METNMKTAAKGAKRAILNGWTSELVGERAIRHSAPQHDLHSRWEHGQYRIRVTVRLDTSCLNTPFAQAEVWNPITLSWQEVAKLQPYECPQTGPDKQDAPLFEAERELLVRAAWALGK